ncbi:uncharacterized protein LOC123938270 isoform X1 [Meles meles]|uniref:uncharacterized protein LOC123938270 isoform X1 n=1 Tax=Meles meles TaxID=9662 RepID=UPI001E69E4BB|nr:uncharacterized protein LOC123938270 isoform X1 [Meles meles]
MSVVALILVLWISCRKKPVTFISELKYTRGTGVREAKGQGMFLEIPLLLEVLLYEIYPGLLLARNYVRAHFSLFEELRETLCDNKSGHFNRKHSRGSVGCLTILLMVMAEVQDTNRNCQKQEENQDPRIKADEEPAGPRGGKFLKTQWKLSPLPKKMPICMYKFPVFPLTSLNVTIGLTSACGFLHEEGSQLINGRPELEHRTSEPKFST